MPLYEFWCTECGKEYEELVAISADRNPPCPDCGSKKVERKISRIGSIGGTSSSCGTSGFT